MEGHKNIMSGSQSEIMVRSTCGRVNLTDAARQYRSGSLRINIYAVISTMMFSFRDFSDIDKIYTKFREKGLINN